jgi:hypothetical protein
LDLTSTGGYLIGGIGVWTGGYYISSVLYTSAPKASALTNTFLPGVSVVAGTEYVAFLSVDGVSDPVTQAAMPTIDTGHPAYLDGFVQDRNESTGETYANSVAWNSGANNLDAFFSATFTADVPEPSTWVMMIVGFCGVGFLAYRQKNGTLRFA